MSLRLHGTIVRNEIRERLKTVLSTYKENPTLAIVQVGDRADSNVYIRQKKLFAEYIGVTVIHTVLPDTSTEQEIIDLIKKYNQDQAIHGILLQLPFPNHIQKSNVLETIVPYKDVDGLTSYNTKLLYDEAKEGMIPATARGIISLLDYYKIELEGKHVVMVGRSALVGKPTALACLNRNATVTIAHKHTKNLAEITKSADILIIAIGDPQFIDKKYVRPDQVVIDVGISEYEEDGIKKLSGDVKASEVESIVAGLSPVPGGVGPMTVASLFENLVDTFVQQRTT